MLSQKRFENNVAQSFDRAKADIGTLYEHVLFLFREVQELKEQNTRLLAQMSNTHTVTQVETKVIEKKPTLIASKTATKVHRDDCFFAKNIKYVNKVVFKSKQQAFKQGYKQCKCLA